MGQSKYRFVYFQLPFIGHYRLIGGFCMGKRVKIEFFGNVKGTGHRFFIKQKAIELGLKGYCQLNNDEKLEVEVEGSINAIDEFIDFVQKGVSLQAESNQFNVQVFQDLKGYKVMKSDIV